MNKKRVLMIIFSMLGILLIVGGLFILLNNKPIDEFPIDDTSRFFDCTQDTYKTDNYKIDYLYHFYFTDNVIQYGSLKYIYTFTSKEEYEKFNIDFTKIGSTVKEDFDEKKLTKTYDVKMQYSQDTEGEKAVDDYIQKLKDLNYSCKEIATEK